MTSIEAIYQGGVLKPLSPLNLRENQKVRLDIRSPEAEAARAWLDEVQDLHRSIIAERGCFPDSSADIAEDRERKE